MRNPPATTILSSSFSRSGNASASARPDSNIARVRCTSNAIKARFGDYKELRLETVGPTVGASVSKNSIISVIAASVGILSTWGPRFGVPQLVQSRGAFGYLGNFLPAGLNALRRFRRGQG